MVNINNDSDEWTVINSGADINKAGTVGNVSGAGNIDWADLMKRAEEYERKEQAELVYNNFRKCGAYKRDMDRAGFDKLQNPSGNVHINELVDLLNRFYQGILSDKDFNKVLVLFGEPGRGKTYFALSLLKEFCATKKPEYMVSKQKPGFDVNGIYNRQESWEKIPSNIVEFHRGYYITSEKLAEMIDGRYKSKQEINDGKSKIELFRTCELLIIDEIGRSLNNQKNEKEILFSVLNTRINEYLPTVLCSNLAERQLQEFFGDALFSRVKSVGRMFCVDGLDDMRMKMR